MPNSRMQALWDYYAAAAAKLGEKQNSDGATYDLPYSLRWYFEEHRPEWNLLTRAFLGDAEAMQVVRQGILRPDDPEIQTALYDGRGSAALRAEDFLEEDPRNPLPDEAQAEAIRAALSMPISFIKGPPGSGKTSGILHLLSCILRQGKTAALVSSNNTAIASVEEKLAGFTDRSQPRQQALKGGFARLGNSDCRREFEQAHRQFFPDSCPTCADMPSERFLTTYPIVASTIHSLPKCFLDWRASGNGGKGTRREPAYDYVIVDESSQVNALLGLIAMGAARHLVLVGDDDQLPPVIDEAQAREGSEEEAAAAQRAVGEDFDRIYALSQERSFLGACREAFLGNDAALSDRCDRMLYFHYRCHPGIIGFCRDAVYSGDRAERTMQIRTRLYDASHAMPIRVLWFEGNFCEKCTWKRRDRDGQWLKVMTKRNRHQVEIFLQEESPELLERLCADAATVLDLDEPRPLSFCVLSPFRGQLWELQERLNAWLADEDNQQIVRGKAIARRRSLIDALVKMGVDAYLTRRGGRSDGLGARWLSDAERAAQIVDERIEMLPGRLRPYIPGEDERVDPQEVPLPELTVHKVQGQEYDIVYFLPVEDTHWEWPWSQKRRLINVAVSRAKRELRIITSAALMSEEVQKALTGGNFVRPWGKRDDAPSAEDSADNAFLQKLIDYIWQKGPHAGPEAWTDGPFGFHRARSRSLFDRVVYIARDRAYADSLPFAPEICLQDWLRELPLVVDNHLSIFTDAPISAIEPQPKGIGPELEAYIRHGAHFDCVICRGNQILLAIEVDGGHHRTQTLSELNDRKKDSVAGEGFHAAMYRAAGGGLTRIEGGAPTSQSGFAFLRLPTDGSAWDEETLIETLLWERLVMEGGAAYELPVRTLDALPYERRRFVFPRLARAQNWITGKPAQRGEPRENVRWVPTEEGAMLGLMLAYLPGWENRLYTGLAIRSADWGLLADDLDDLL